MVKKPVKVILDTNVIISALVFGGKPEKVFELVLNKQVKAYVSPILLAELIETLIKKFRFTQEKIQKTERIIKNNFFMIQPYESLNILKDTDDNRILEAAVEGECDYIITGDKELLKLGSFKKIKILTSGQFLRLFQG